MESLFIKKFNTFIYEKFNGKDIEDIISHRGIKHISILNALKDISNELRLYLSNIQIPHKFTKNYLGVDIEISISYGVNSEYYANVNLFGYKENKYSIPIFIPMNYDLDYLISSIIHEIRHIIDFNDYSIDAELSSFKMALNLDRFNDIRNYKEFHNAFYLSMEHELVARNNQIYPFVKFKKVDKNRSLSLLKSTFIWKSMDILNNFDVDKFMNKFKVDDLMDITNNFIENIFFQSDNKIENERELKHFYIICDKYFKAVGKEWKLNMLAEFNKIYDSNQSNLNKLPNSKYTSFINELYTKIFTKIL